MTDDRPTDPQALALWKAANFAQHYGTLPAGQQQERCRCRNLADEHMPPSERIGDTEARRRGLLSTEGCAVHTPASEADSAGEAQRTAEERVAAVWDEGYQAAHDDWLAREEGQWRVQARNPYRTAGAS